jgi:hypothetical protein
MKANDTAFTISGDFDTIEYGMTKRELVAAMALAGILANPNTANPSHSTDNAMAAVRNADALIEQLS